MSPLNNVLQLVWIAKRCGSQLLDNVECFDHVIGRSRFAELDSGALRIARRIVETKFDGVSQTGVKDSKSS